MAGAGDHDGNPESWVAAARIIQEVLESSVINSGITLSIAAVPVSGGLGGGGAILATEDPPRTFSLLRTVGRRVREDSY